MEPDETYLELRSHYSNVREVMRASARSKSMVPPQWNKSSNPNSSVQDRLSTAWSEKPMSLEDKILNGYFKPFAKRDPSSFIQEALKDLDEDGVLAC